MNKQQYKRKVNLLWKRFWGVLIAPITAPVLCIWCILSSLQGLYVDINRKFHGVLCSTCFVCKHTSGCCIGRYTIFALKVQPLQLIIKFRSCLEAYFATKMYHKSYAWFYGVYRVSFIEHKRVQISGKIYILRIFLFLLKFYTERFWWDVDGLKSQSIISKFIFL